MSKKTSQVQAGYAELSESEKNEVRIWIREYDSSPSFKQRNLSENANLGAEKRSVGPRDSNACACCGRA